MVPVSGGKDTRARFSHEAKHLGPHHDVSAVELGRSCYRARRTGERKHTSLCNALWMPGLNVLNLVIVKNKEGEKDNTELRDTILPWWLGHK